LQGVTGATPPSSVSDTIRNWDSEAIATKLEQNVGRDLQYVRINGTIIGGIVGLAVHQIGVFLN
jgi:uncharacterized membrane-anchored protein YjiN (DUF445 family)